MPSIVPARLRKGDTIALVSPSMRVTKSHPNLISRAISVLEAPGYHVRDFTIPDLSNDYPTSLRQRASEIHSAFSDPTIKAILCVTGGLTATEILPFLDFDLIRQHPKIFSGFSDITLLHHAIFTKTGLRTFYGPGCIPNLSELPHAQPLTPESFFATVAPEDGREVVGKVPRSERWTDVYRDLDDEEKLDPSAGPVEARPTRPNAGWKWLRGGKGEGRLFGGCLPSVCQMTGTPYLPPGMYDGRVLLLELPEGDSGDGKPFEAAIARLNVADLRNCGVLTSKLQGLVLGRPYLYDEKATVHEWEEMVLELCYETDFPILAGVDVGHTDPIVTLPLDAMVRLDAEKDLFEILEAGVQ